MVTSAATISPARRTTSPGPCPSPPSSITPQAPLHVLIVPRAHIATANDLTPDHDALVGAMARRAAAIAKDRGYDASGFRVVFNCNRDGGQSVFHIHLHLLAGRPLAWPPG
ncbi:MAG: histidine triad nucleotide-binding protein [Acidobacteria bacterium 37-65-4]|nr:MAG: histidine triad nucleotide-binding protein [Acidobacteria bacterium 37-65-4]